MVYLLDSNVFIGAKNLHYGFDFCPAFWDWLIGANSKGRVFSIDRVGEELDAGNDELSRWASDLGNEFFLAPPPSMASALGVVGEWIVSQDYEPAATISFLQVADQYLIAHALAEGYTVVTHEVPSKSKKRIKIPNVCLGLGVRCRTPFEMLRNEQARFVLGSRA